MVDDVQMVHYDSNTRRAQPKQEWMKEVTADDPQYLDRTLETSWVPSRTSKSTLKLQSSASTKLECDDASSGLRHTPTQQNAETGPDLPHSHCF
ncbi:hypothetical protein D4764_21G0004370 [Takifugu flavidus]|uniref:MHC class I-like antigen recognition-like domain-containing protein n=1 Tax=Takifugu flavidus TaxID=433684 RepID=A0A5C6NIU2_9TELE|nr:hypothetical protein D4764_21G0004370 [Takifugu flavidus]